MVGQTAKERLVGSWTLVALTAGEGADQTLPYGPNPKGSMMVDANGRFMITVKVEGSTFPNFIGGTQTRILSFNGDDEVTYLNPTPSHGGAPAKVTYRRVK